MKACMTLLLPSCLNSILAASVWWWLAVCAAHALLADGQSLPAGIILKEGLRFDYIVVGAGAGGAAAAARLALAGHRVLLVEAGGDPSALSTIPSASMALLGSEVDWQYRTMSNNKSCFASKGQQCRFSRGKCLGGSTSINYMMYTRGNRQDFQDMPVDGWTWEDMMPYFLKYEGLQDLDLLPPSSKPYHNTTGIMRIGFFDQTLNPWHSKLIKSFQTLGFPENRDVNAHSQIGVSNIIGYVYDGERMSTARAYLTGKDVRRTLKVAKFARCTGVIIDERNVARGITVVQGFLTVKVYARKEVILSAGTIGTPQILMLSGVGPADHLQSMGIHVKVDLPDVGANMTDHVLPLVLALVDDGEGTRPVQELSALAEQLTQLLVSRAGPLTSIGLTDVTVFANTHCYDYERRKLLNESFDGTDCELPNLQIIHAYIDRNLVLAAKPVFKQSTGFNDDIVHQIIKANKDYSMIVISPVHLYPYSVGHVRLASADPTEPPAIYPNYLSDERDVEDTVRSLMLVEQLMETPLFKQRKASLLQLELPGCGSARTDRAGYWRCYSRHMTFAVYHAAGTCSLGGVVDARLRVRGVRRLRVADLSVLPRVPRGNTAAVTVAIGERLADFVLEDI